MSGLTSVSLGCYNPLIAEGDLGVATAQPLTYDYIINVGCVGLPGFLLYNSGRSGPVPGGDTFSCLGPDQVAVFKSHARRSDRCGDCADQLDLSGGCGQYTVVGKVSDAGVLGYDYQVYEIVDRAAVTTSSSVLVPTLTSAAASSFIPPDVATASSATSSSSRPNLPQSMTESGTTSTFTSTTSSSSVSGIQSPTPPAYAVTTGNSVAPLSGGAIAGIVIAILAALALGAAIMYLLMRRRRNTNDETNKAQIAMNLEAAMRNAQQQPPLNAAYVPMASGFAVSTSNDGAVSTSNVGAVFIPVPPETAGGAGVTVFGSADKDKSQPAIEAEDAMGAKAIYVRQEEMLQRMQGGTSAAAGSQPLPPYTYQDEQSK